MTTGLRPLGQVDGLQAIEPTTAIRPPAQPPVDRRRNLDLQRLATGLDWDNGE